MVNKPHKDTSIPGGLFGCTDDDAHPTSYLSIRAVAPLPFLSGRTVYGHFITALRGFDSWGYSDGLKEGNVRLRTHDETEFFWGGIFLMQLALMDPAAAALTAAE